MSEMAPLNPLRLPLQGIQLIEASAGTGKTWTLAALYVRLVLGHGGQPPLMPAQILVVTFTRAATAELRERIRERLATAAAAFRGLHEPDAFLQQLIGEYPQPDDRAAAARQLELAAQWMDEAAVYTIHGWCQRMLAQHVFEGKDSTDEMADENARLAEAVRDYWRRFYAALEQEDAASVATQWRDPQTLQRVIKPLLRISTDHLRWDAQPLAVVGNLVETLHRRDAPRRDAAQAARQLWLADAEAIEQMVREAVLSKVLKNNIFKPESLDRDMSALRDWLHTGRADETLLARYTQAKLASSTSKNNVPPTHAAFSAMQTLVDIQNAETPLKPLLLAHAIPWINARIEQIRAILTETIAAQYPLALIDEFQDTDPLQWRIFQRIYAQREQTGLLLIGDPKQAIYAFRGADIHTYLAAREEARQPTWTLTTNYRSTPGLVNAVNRIFTHAQSQPRGAFAFGHGTRGLPFIPVQDSGPKPTLRLDHQPLPAMQWDVLSHDGTMAGGAYIEAAAAHAAARIVEWLDAAQDGRCAFFDQALHTPLRPRDIAVLVRGRSEASAMR